MSIASELNRLLQAKSDLATSIAAKGVTVPSATTIDGYAALVDQIQQGGGTLPYDAEVEYLENSTGKENLYVCINADNTTEVEFKWQQFNTTLSDYTGGDCISLGRLEWNNSLNANAFGLSYNKTQNALYYSRGNKYAARTSTSIDTNAHIYIISKSYIKIDGTQYVGASTANIACYDPIKIFSGGCRRSKLYYIKSRKDDNLVFDGIPVRVGTVGYLYDRISGQLFGNVGTGAFILGPDVT